MPIISHLSKRPSVHGQHGFTLLEVMVAILVVAGGLLGLAALMNAGLRNNQSANAQTQAVWLAYDMLDRLRADRVNALAAAGANYNVALGAASSSSAAFPKAQVTEWKTLLAANLPVGDGSVVVNPTTREVTVVVQWSDARVKGGLGTRLLQIDSRL